MHLRLLQLLANERATLLDTFSCPHHPDVTGPCDCRKPGTALFERAARLHGLDLSRCLYIGDRHRDVAAAGRFGGQGLLVISPATPEEEISLAEREGVRLASSLLEGVRDVLTIDA